MKHCNWFYRWYFINERYYGKFLTFIMLAMRLPTDTFNIHTPGHLRMNDDFGDNVAAILKKKKKTVIGKEK